MKLTFLGAAQTVTGSMHLVESGGSRILLDCGLYQGPRAEAYERNRRLPAAAVAADACVLSHAHIDHSGNLPGLLRAGFAGRIHASVPTKDLCEVMLRDSAHIQEQDFRHLSRRGIPVREPLYNMAAVDATLARFVPNRYGVWFNVVAGVRCRFLDAGHILGSAVTELELVERGAVRRLCFTGDLGRRGMPILRDPEPLPSTDVVITESTYGDRTHPPLEDNEAELARIIRDEAKARGRILIPAFSVGRTQNLLYSLFQIYRRGDAPRLPIFVDSPLSSQVTQIVSKHPECFDQEALAILGSSGAAFNFPEVRYVDTVDESKALNRRDGSFIVISASGMCESGRIVHHLRNWLGNPSTLVLIVGFQAPGTLGRRLVEKLPVVRVLGDEITVAARVVTMTAMSAHADRDDLTSYLEPVARACGHIFVVHGEPKPAASLATILRGRGCASVQVPSLGQSFDV